VLERVLQAHPEAGQADVVTMLAAAVAKSADVPSVQRILVRAANADTPACQRSALLQGLDSGLPSAGGGRGGRGGRGPAQPVRLVSLPGEPVELTRLAAVENESGVVAKRVAAKLDWPGKPAPVVAAAVPLTPEQQQRYDAGADLYKSICVGCHQPDGRGKEKIAPSLVDSRYVTAPDAGAATRVLLGGKEGTIGLMPPLGSALKDEQIASVLTYIRREWGHTGSAVAPEDVTEIRGLTKTRTRPWTDAELQAGGRGGRGGVAGRGGQ
jgi:mono/diheme cytochrome c family protein